MKLYIVDDRLILSLNGERYDVTNLFAAGIRRYKRDKDIGIIKLDIEKNQSLRIVEVLN